MDEAGVSVAEDGVSVSRDHTAFAESLSHELLDHHSAGTLAFVVVFEFAEPFEAFLVGEAVERPGEAVHGGGEGKIGVSKSRADKHTGVGGNVAALMVGMDGKITADALLHLEVVESHHVGEVAGPVKGGVGLDEVAVVVLVAVDGRDELGQLGQQIHGVVVVELPVLGLVDALRVGFEEFAVALDVQHRHRQHRHRVVVFRQAGNEPYLLFAQLAFPLPIA